MADSKLSLATLLCHLECAICNAGIIKLMIRRLEMNRRTFLAATPGALTLATATTLPASASPSPSRVTARKF